MSEGQNAPGIALSLPETVRILGWARDHTDALRRHISWLRDLEGKDLPGAEIVVAEIKKDLAANTELMLRLFDHRNSLSRDAEDSASAPASGEGAEA